MKARSRKPKPAIRCFTWSTRRRSRRQRFRVAAGNSPNPDLEPSSRSECRTIQRLQRVIRRFESVRRLGQEPGEQLVRWGRCNTGKAFLAAIETTNGRSVQRINPAAYHEQPPMRRTDDRHYVRWETGPRSESIKNLSFYTSRSLTDSMPSTDPGPGRLANWQIRAFELRRANRWRGG